MIVGIGTDLVDIRRIEKVLLRFGERFVGRCFAPMERLSSTNISRCASFYAKRYAAKEACAKALGLGISFGIRLVDLNVVNDRFGKPIMCVSGIAEQRLLQLLPSGFSHQIHLTLSDEYPMAQAFVVISAHVADDSIC